MRERNTDTLQNIKYCLDNAPKTKDFEPMVDEIRTHVFSMRHKPVDAITIKTWLYFIACLIILASVPMTAPYSDLSIRSEHFILKPHK
jgi:hypothetical protein